MVKLNGNVKTEITTPKCGNVGFCFPTSCPISVFFKQAEAAEKKTPMKIILGIVAYVEDTLE